MIPENPWLAALAVLVAIVGVGRATRILTYDDFPPAVWVRIQWSALTKDGPWAKLATCYWCASPWMMLACIGTGLASFTRPWEPAWWLFWGWMALSYVSAMLIARDEPSQ